MSDIPMRIAFLHPDLGIGGAERLVVDVALGLQQRGHEVHIYTSHHDPTHCFEETRDGTLSVHAITPPPFLPRSFKNKGHIFFAHLRQLHLTFTLLSETASSYDIFFVDQLSTCIPFLRLLAGKRVVFYGHFPDKLLAEGEFIEGVTGKKRGGLKGLYRMPMDWLEEVTTRQADILLVNSKFTARVFREYFPSVTAKLTPRVVYPGINVDAYTKGLDRISLEDEDIKRITSTRPTLISLNRFEKKKNAALAIDAFALVLAQLTQGDKQSGYRDLRLVLAGGYDPRLQDNIDTLTHLTTLAQTHGLSYEIIASVPLPSSISSTSQPSPSSTSVTHPQITFLLNFTSSQRTYLLSSPHTLALIYTPANEHFGIGPVEAMVSGLPVVACGSGGPVESVEDPDFALGHVVKDGEEAGNRTGYLLPQQPEAFAKAILRIIHLPSETRKTISERAKKRALDLFSLNAMTDGVEEALDEAVKMGDVTRIWEETWVLFVIAVLLGIVLNVVARWVRGEI